MDQSMGKLFGRRLENLLDERDIRKIDFARMLNVEPSTITKYCQGRIPDAKTVAKIAELLRINPAYLIGADVFEVATVDDEVEAALDILQVRRDLTPEQRSHLRITLQALLDSYGLNKG